MRYSGYVVLFCLLLFFFLPVAKSPAQEEVLKITEMTVTTMIVRKNPVDSVRRISASSERILYCFTKVAGPDEEERRIFHVWYRNDETIAEYELPVRGSRWRTYSKKKIEKGMRGAWRVEARDDEGHLLKTVEFTLY